jgi:hypothetical protein
MGCAIVCHGTDSGTQNAAVAAMAVRYAIRGGKPKPRRLRHSGTELADVSFALPDTVDPRPRNHGFLGSLTHMPLICVSIRYKYRGL